MVGLLALLILLGGSLWLLFSEPTGRKGLENERLLRYTVASGLVVMLVHSMVEDFVYGSAALPILLAGPGLAVAMYSGGKSKQRRMSRREVRSRHRAVIALSLASCFLLLGMASLPSTRASWHANIGALQMARVELRGWPTGQWNDGSGMAKLAPAEARFQRSIEADPNNRSARYRLGLLAMLRRQYGPAVEHLKIADRAGGRHEGIQKALGYSYIWSGAPESGIPLLVDLPQIDAELEAYERWWNRQGSSALAARARQAARELERHGSSSNGWAE